MIEKNQLIRDTFGRLCNLKKTALFNNRKQTHANIHAYKSSIGKRHPLILSKIDAFINRARFHSFFNMFMLILNIIII